MAKRIEFDIPDVPAPTNPFLGYWGSQLIIGHFSDSPKVVTLSSTFVRCVFSAREDYLAATQHLRAAFQSTREMHLSELYRSISRFETCISGMYLAERAFRRLRRCVELSADSAAVINHEKPAFIAPAVRDRLKAMRDTMQHIEELLAMGKLTEDLPYMVQPTGDEHPQTDSAQLADTVLVIDRLRIGEHVVRFSEVVEWLGEMIAYVEKLRSLMPTRWTSTLDTMPFGEQC
ncbi:hypothetical protein [Burkholderia ubonensis]|uniref:hypothetical protein n=1 Tax=Burkholderia ubonensis TaxID=101571 RepID=UPI0008FE071C|nr:hypothetical protein [Burkholderia ubonensis]